MRSYSHHRAVQVVCRESLRNWSLIHRKKHTRVIFDEPVGMDRVGLIRHQIGIHFASTTGRTHRCGQVRKRTLSIVDSIWRLEQVFTVVAWCRALGIGAGDGLSKDHCAGTWRRRGARRRIALCKSLCGGIVARIYAELPKITYAT